MIVERPGAARGAVDVGWLHSRHTFSFGHYHDPEWMGFGLLRVINDDTVAPGGGFAPHRHANMEILSVVLDGALAHRDSTGHAGVIVAGDVQWMSAGRGIEHSEYNASDSAPVHFLQLWIQPDRLNTAPAYAQKHFARHARRGRWVTLAAGDGADGALPLHQDARLLATRLEAGKALAIMLDSARSYWLHVATGCIRLDAQEMDAGDALGFVEEGGTRCLQGVATVSDVLLFDLPAPAPES